MQVNLDASMPPPALDGVVRAPRVPAPADEEAVLSEGDWRPDPQLREVADADAEPHAAAAGAEPKVIGFIDEVDAAGRLIGWACVSGRHDQRVEVEIYDGDALLCMGIADHYRQDLDDAKISDGASGFALSLPPGLLTGARRSLVVRFEAARASPLVLRHVIGAVPGLPGPGDKATATSNSHLVRAKPLNAAGIFATPASASLYVAGQYVLTRAPYPAPPYHVSGWHDPELEFTWIRGFEATIEMYIRSPRQSYTFAIDVMPNGIARQVQTLEIFFNRQRLGFAEVPRRMTVAVEVPREVFTSRVSVVNLHCRNAVVGTDFGSTDDRRLGIAVRGWQLT